MRPRVFMEGAAPIPVLDEYDFRGVQIGTIANIFPSDTADRTFTLWFALDRRSAMTLQKETVRNVGKNLLLIIRGQVVGIHPIEKGIANGMLPVILSNFVTEESAVQLYQELSQSLVHIQAEFEEQKQ